MTSLYDGLKFLKGDWQPVESKDRSLPPGSACEVMYGAGHILMSVEPFTMNQLTFCCGVGFFRGNRPCKRNLRMLANILNNKALYPYAVGTWYYDEACGGLMSSYPVLLTDNLRLGSNPADIGEFFQLVVATMEYDAIVVMPEAARLPDINIKFTGQYVRDIVGRLTQRYRLTREQVGGMM